MKSWYTIKNQSKDAVDIDIFDDIGIWGIPAKDFIANLQAAGAVKTINVRINSYGGEVFDGLAIYNALKFHAATVNVTVYGIAASIASVIAMAGDKIMMPENAFMFVHQAQGLVLGNSEDMTEMSEALRKFDGSIRGIYVTKTGQSDEKIAEMMASDTWLGAGEAKELGFADVVLEPVQIAARADLNRFKNLPEGLRQAVEQTGKEPELFPDKYRALNEPPEPAPAPVIDDTAAAILARAGAILAMCQAAGVPNRAAAYNRLAMTIEEVQCELAEIEGQRKDEERERAAQVFKLCVAAGVGDLAGEFLEKGMTIEAVRDRLKHAATIKSQCCAAAHRAGIPSLQDRSAEFIRAGLTPSEVALALSKVLAAVDIQIDNKLPGDGFSALRPQAKVLNLAEIYRQRSAKPQADGNLRTRIAKALLNGGA